MWLVYRAEERERQQACVAVMATATTHNDTLRVRIACELSGEDALRAVPR